MMGRSGRIGSIGNSPRGARSGAGAVLARRSRVILRGRIGLCSQATAPGSGPSPAPDPAVSAERSRYGAAYGAEWPGALEAFSRRLREAGIPLRVGAAELAGSRWLATLGWAGADIPAFRCQVSAPGWVLRVPAGWGGVVRGWIEEDGRLQAAGAPAIVVEESALAFLPADPSAPCGWPPPDAWRHAARIVFPSVRGRTVRSPLIPKSPEDLVALLRAPAAPGRSPVPADRAAQMARDLLEAAWAWDGNASAFWLAERAALALPEAEAAARARDRGVRLRPPCVQRSAACAASEGLVVLRGLDEVCGAGVAATLVTERTRSGRFAGLRELVSRVRRRGIGWNELARLVLAGSFEVFGDARGSLVRNMAGHLLVAARSGFVPVPREAAPRSSNISSRSRGWRAPVPARCS